MTPAPVHVGNGHDRHLKAIVFTDIVGYSARMQQDEVGTLTSARHDFERIKAIVSQNAGEVLKSTGDGMLLSFSSVVAAVASALQIQQEMGARSGGSLQHRIGIHLGDVFHDGKDVLGDGVNIAARLESKARPGSVCISQSVYDAVKGKVRMQIEALGPQAFKNIAEPINVYLVAPAGAAMPAATHARPGVLIPAILLVAAAFGLAYFLLRPERAAPVAARAALTPAAVEKSLAVLPFTNMSEDKANAFFADGVHEDVLTNLSYIRDLRLVSRTSVLQYRGTSKTVRQIAGELGVAYILEGSVRRAGNRVRVTGQLIRADTDEHIWAKAYDRDMTDVFAIQAELAQAIAAAMKTVITTQEKSLLEHRPTKNQAAYDLYVKARANYGIGYGSSAMVDLEPMLAEAVRLDPDFAEAWALLAGVHSNLYFAALDATPARLEKAKTAMDTAVRLAPDDPLVIQMLGDYHYYAFRDYARAALDYQRLLALQPQSANAYGSLGLILRRQGKWTEALENLRRAERMDPRNTRFVEALAEHLVGGRRYQEAADIYRRLADLKPPGYEYQFGARVLTSYLTNRSTAEVDAWLAGLPVPAEDKDRVQRIRRSWARLHGDYAAALRIDQSLSPFPATITATLTATNSFPRWADEFLVAFDYIGAGDLKTGHARLAKLRPLMADQVGKVTAEKPYWNGPFWYYWGLVNAALGEKREPKQAADRLALVLPESVDAVSGPSMSLLRAQVLAWSGDKEQALKELARLLRTPYGTSREDARFDLGWLPLRGDPQFEQLLADPRNGEALF
jgi:TolB-like protein/class 3 adenylate cyclase/Tfp pilus assembly protein PilF